MPNAMVDTLGSYLERRSMGALKKSILQSICFMNFFNMRFAQVNNGICTLKNNETQ